jgi:preprotein translocase subunit SecB
MRYVPARQGGDARLDVLLDLSARPQAVFGSKLLVGVNFALKASDQSTQRPALAIDGEFELAYKLPEDIKATQAEARAFAESNAILNVWPYWREFVQNSITRMNLPPLTLPLFRVLPRFVIDKRVGPPLRSDPRKRSVPQTKRGAARRGGPEVSPTR